MEFALSEDQRLLQESVAGTLSRVCPLDTVRATAEARLPMSKDVWQSLVELGVPGILVPDTYGGAGLGLLDAALVAEALGQAVAPVPFVGACVMAPLALSELGSEMQKETWLPKIAAGELVMGVALSERASGARQGAGVTASDGKLSGTALFVTDCLAADAFVIADNGGALYLVEGAATGLTRSPLTSIDLTRSVGELKLEKVEAELIGNGDPQGFTRVRDAGRVILAADTLGAGETMIEKAVEYAKERKQFNRVIASFQAVKHMCAEMAAELEPCRSLVWYAGHAFDAIPEESGLTAAHAKAHLSEVGRFVARTATEVHGGMGFTDLLGLHYWFKRIGLNRQLLGSPERCREDAARLQGLAA